MPTADQIRAAAKRLVEIGQTLRELEAEKKKLKAIVDPVANQLFKPQQVGPIDMGEGLRAVRSLHSTKIRVSSLPEALDWAKSVGADVLVEAPISKVKLDDLGVTYSDNRVLFAGEVVPGLYTETLHSISYEADK